MRKLYLPPGITHADAMQEAALRITARYPAYTGRYLHRRVWGDMLDLYGREFRRHYKQETYPHPAPHRLKDSLPSPARTTSDPEAGLVLDVRAAVDGLTDDQREVVRLVAFEGLSHREAAERLGVNPHAVTMRYARAKAVLAETLKDYA